jgi:hypothetical protein
MAVDIIVQLEQAFAGEGGDRAKVIGEAIEWIKNMRRENGYLRRSIEEVMRGKEKDGQ